MKHEITAALLLSVPVSALHLLVACMASDPNMSAPSCPSAKRAAGEDLPSGHYRTFEGGSPQCPFDSFDLQLAGDSARGYAPRKSTPGSAWRFPGGGWAKYTYTVPAGGGWGTFRMVGPAPAGGGDPPVLFDAQFQVLDSTEYRLMYGAACVFALRKSIVLPDSTEVWPNPPSTGIRPPQVKPKACQE